jgi:hypothetical protein
MKPLYEVTVTYDLEDRVLIRRFIVEATHRWSAVTKTGCRPSNHITITTHPLYQPAT